MKILVIEDDRDAAEYVRKAFDEAGHTTHIAFDGETGFNLASDGDYDVLVVDRMLPKRDGLAVISELRARGNTTPVLILSALGVPRPVIEQDYLLTTTHYRQPHLPSSMASQEVLDVLWTVQPGFLAAALQVVDADYGGIEAYLEKAIGLAAPARTRLEQMYLVR